MSGPVNLCQQVLYDLCFQSGLVEPKRVAYRLRKADNYIWDICRRDRVDFPAVFNAILQEAEAGPINENCAIANRVLPLLTAGTRWRFHYPPPAEPPGDIGKLYEQTGVLLQDLGAALESLARIERDGAVTAADDPDIEAFLVKNLQLTHRLHAIGVELRRRREGVGT